MGTLVDREKAETEGCVCYKIDPDKPENPDNLMCHVSGILGTLSDSQDREFCEEKFVAPSRRYKQIQKFSKMGSIMDVCAEDEVSESEFGECIAKGGELVEEGRSGNEIEEKLSKTFDVPKD